VLFAVLSVITSATPPPIDERTFQAMPRSAEVLSTVQGADMVDTYARQLAAFEVLAQMISMNEMVEYHMELLPIEKELLADYRSYIRAIAQCFQAQQPLKAGSLGTAEADRRVPLQFDL
jgi:hypothetical protein